LKPLFHLSHAHPPDSKQLRHKLASPGAELSVVSHAGASDTHNAHAAGCKESRKDTSLNRV
jgi:hypothetical protein